MKGREGKIYYGGNLLRNERKAPRGGKVPSFIECTWKKSVYAPGSGTRMRDCEKRGGGCARSAPDRTSKEVNEVGASEPFGEKKDFLAVKL